MDQIRPLTTGDHEGYVEEGSGDRHLSLHRGPAGEPGRGHIYWGLKDE